MRRYGRCAGDAGDEDLHREPSHPDGGDDVRSTTGGVVVPSPVLDAELDELADPGLHLLDVSDDDRASSEPSPSNVTGGP